MCRLNDMIAMCHLTTRLCYKKCITRWFSHCGNGALAEGMTWLQRCKSFITEGNITMWHSYKYGQKELQPYLPQYFVQATVKSTMKPVFAYKDGETALPSTGALPRYNSMSCPACLFLVLGPLHLCESWMKLLAPAIDVAQPRSLMPLYQQMEEQSPSLIFYITVFKAI